MASFNFADLFELAVDAVPERTSLVVGDVRRTYAELEARANRLAHFLARSGVEPGQHVGIYAVNGKEWVEGMYAAYKIRAAAVNVNYRYVEDELRYVFSNADLAALVFRREYAPRVAAVRGDVPTLRTLIVSEDGSGADTTGLDDAVEYEEALGGESPERDFGPRSGDDRYLLYTGGTTGMPKGVVWRHEDIFFALAGGIDAFSGERVRRPEEISERAREAAALGATGMRFFVLPPLMHGAGQMAALRALHGGDTAVMIPRFDAEEVWRIVDREKVNVISMTGDAMARPLAEALERLRDEVDVSSVMSMGSSAAIWSPVVKDHIARLVPHAVLTDSIGSSESGMNGIRVVQADDVPRNGGPNVTAVRDTVVLDEQTLRPLEPGSGVIGKMARTGNVPLGYYKDPERTAATFPVVDGVRYAISGDYAIAEADGTITLLGRGSQSINTGGEKVFPEEVEAALKSHPDVFDALVVGLPDERWGERVTAVVQARPGRAPTLEELDAHCRQHVAGYKVPRQVFLVDEAPRLVNGKPDYRRARQVAEEAAGTAPRR